MPKSELHYTVMDSPIGRLVLASSRKGLAAILLPGKGNPQNRLREIFPKDLILEDRQFNRHAVNQVQSYFSGKRRIFDLPLDLRGTPFQMRVWKALGRVPYGETRSYGEIARAIGKPTACRAVGMANRANPIPIVIPCHRIIGKDGTMTGFSGGIPLKKKLLDLEEKT